MHVNTDNTHTHIQTALTAIIIIIIIRTNYYYFIFIFRQRSVASCRCCCSTRIFYRKIIPFLPIHTVNTFHIRSIGICHSFSFWQDGRRRRRLLRSIISQPINSQHFVECKCIGEHIKYEYCRKLCKAIYGRHTRFELCVVYAMSLHDDFRHSKINIQNVYYAPQYSTCLMYNYIIIKWYEFAVWTTEFRCNGIWFVYSVLFTHSLVDPEILNELWAIRLLWLK